MYDLGTNMIWGHGGLSSVGGPVASVCRGPLRAHSWIRAWQIAINRQSSSKHRQYMEQAKEHDEQPDLLKAKYFSSTITRSVKLLTFV